MALFTAEYRKDKEGYMKQVLQDMGQGATTLTSAPAPGCTAGNLLINTSITLVSAGTERMLVDFGKASYLQKARQQPEKVKMVLEKVQTDGLMTTIEAVQSKLAQPLPLATEQHSRLWALEGSTSGEHPAQNRLQTPQTGAVADGLGN